MLAPQRCLMIWLVFLTCLTSWSGTAGGGGVLGYVVGEGEAEVEETSTASGFREGFYPVPPRNERSIIVVGNGESLRDSGLGSVIDSYETVVRFNHFKTKGFEKDVGTKTSVWVLAQIREPDKQDPDEVKNINTVLSPFISRPCKDQMRPCAQGDPGFLKHKWEAAKEKMADMKEKIEKSPVLPPGTSVSVTSMPGNIRLYDKYGLVEKFPSSGLQVINYFLEKHAAVHIVGFDFETANHQHYWEKKLKDETCHNMGGEAKVINAMMAEGVVKRLGPIPPNDQLQESTGYDPNCKIICDLEKQKCAKITGEAFKKYESMDVERRKKKSVAYWKKEQKEKEEKKEKVKVHKVHKVKVQPTRDHKPDESSLASGLYNERESLIRELFPEESKMLAKHRKRSGGKHSRRRPRREGAADSGFAGDGDER